MIVAGIGSRKGVAAAEVVALVDRALAEAGLDRAMLSALATIAAKAQEPGIAAAAAELGLPLLQVAPSDAAACWPDGAAGRLALQKFGVGSVSEASALAAAGEGSALMRPRIKSARVTCALARSTPGTPIAGNGSAPS